MIKIVSENITLEDALQYVYNEIAIMSGREDLCVDWWERLLRITSSYQKKKMP